MIKKNLTLVCGKSGSGKDYLTNIFGCKMVISHTTRPKRDGEINGVHKHFHKIVCEDYRKDFVAYTKRGKNEYWVSSNDLFDADFYIIDPPGILYLLENDIIQKRFNIKIVYINCPWYKRIFNMRIRGEKWKNIFERLMIDHHDFQSLKYIQHETINV
jgi:guanylate kinase